MKNGIGVLAGSLLLGLMLNGMALNGMALAQGGDPAAGETVSWTVSAKPADVANPGKEVTLTLHGAVRGGWHVYGLKQLPNGPTPLVVKLDANAIAAADGAVKGSPTTKFHDPGFNLDTELYTRDFTVALPLRVASHAASGRQSIPVSVRFQTCNGLICQPPKTVHLSAAVTVQ